MHRVISILLILQISFGAFSAELPSRGESELNNPEVQSTLSEVIEPLRKELVASGAEDFPTNSPKSPNSKDAFHLTGQTLVIQSKAGRTESYDLSSLNLSLGTVDVPEIQKKLKVEVDPTANSVSFVLEGAVPGFGESVIRHVIPGLDAIAVASDEKLTVFLDREGVLYGMDAAYARGHAFKGPLPVFKLLKVDAFTPEVISGNLKASFLTRGLDVEMDEALIKIKPLDHVLNAGDFVIHQNKKAIGIFDRAVIQSQIYTGEAVLSMLAFPLVAPVGGEKLLGDVARFQKDEEVRKNTLKLSRNNGEGMDPVLRRALNTLSPSAVKNLASRAHANLSGTFETRDRIALEEFRESVEKLKEQARQQSEKESNPDLRAALENGDLGAYWKQLEVQSRAPKADSGDALAESFFYRSMNPKAMKIIAVITAGGAALLATQGVLDGNGPAWAIHIVNQIYNDYWPNVLKDTAYRITLLKSTLFLSSFVPILWGVAALVKKKTGANWSTVKMLAIMGIRIYASVQLLFFHYVAKLARQPTFITAMQHGINPFTKMVNPLLKGEEFRRAVEINSKAIESQAEQKSRTRALSWALAFAVVGENSGMDPATLSLISTEKLEALAKPGFQKEWARTAEELYFTLSHFSSSTGGRHVEDLSKINPKEFAEYYRLAKESATRAKESSRFHSMLVTFKYRWNHLPSDWMAAVANFGVAEHHFMKRVLPSDFVSSQSWKILFTDYLLMVGQIATVGARADSSHPEALAADAAAFGYTNPAHLADMADSIAYYTFSRPSQLAMVYQKDAPPSDHLYEPIENLALSGESKTEGFWKGIGHWAKGASDLAEADYPSLWLKDLIKRVKVFQASVLFFMTARLLISDQSFYDAFMAYFMILVWTTWGYSWFWDFVTRGNEMYSMKFEKAQEDFTRSKSKLGRGLKFDIESEIQEGIKELMDLYKEVEVPLPDGVLLSEEVLKNPELLSQIKDQVAESREAMVVLRRAMESGDLGEIGKAKSQLISMYKMNDTRALERLNGLSLLEFSLKNPPFAIQQNRAVPWATTVLASVVTTYLSTSLYVDSYRTDMNWLQEILELGTASAILFAGTVYTQKWIQSKWGKEPKDSLAEKIKVLREKMRGPKTCAGLLTDD